MCRGEILKVWLLVVVTIGIADPLPLDATELEVSKELTPFLIDTFNIDSKGIENEWPRDDYLEKIRRNTRGQVLLKHHVCKRIPYDLKFNQSGVEFRPPSLPGSQCEEKKGKFGELCQEHYYTMWIAKRSFNSNCWEPEPVSVPQCEAYHVSS